MRFLVLFALAFCVVAWFGAEMVNDTAWNSAGSSHGQRAEEPQRTGATSRESRERTENRRQTLAAKTKEPRQTSRGGKVKLKMGRGGHYYAEVKVNGRKLDMVVDTGASLIALTAKDAKRLRVYPRKDQFIYETSTANGVAKVAVVELKEVRIGGIRVKGVRATVHRDNGLTVNLLGMSFLNRLRKVNFEGDTLTLVN
ncbi:MAG: TIGR02281 family clan AA aspartic protease [Pseudomonadota bacterium]